ncbi:MAG: 16S rRNA (adenine(1518)-N(6)/adenine(1519)-N(6))-dimethyltransferase RsmA [Pseudomonadales bacterium]
MNESNHNTVSHTARKRFGQNFLQDGLVIDNILRAIGPKSGDQLVEIGPGQAALTQPMVDQLADNSSLNLLEIDRDLAAQLELQFANDQRINIHLGDALDFDFATLRQQVEKPLRVFGNLPYNISTPLIFHLLQQAAAEPQADVISDMHFMLQREVVDRMAAPPGSKTYGRLSIMTQYYCAVEPLFDVPPEAFSPKPKVMSAIVRLLPYKTLPLQADQPQILDKVVRAAFAQRRKTLRNGLKGLISADQLEALNVDPTSRAETLDIATFVKIANALK